jgi:hypothetical protein
VTIMISVTLRGVPIDVFDQINRELGAIEDPPPGLVVHFVHPVDEDTVRIIGVWTSEDVHDAYDEVKDPPSVLARILADRGLDPPHLVGREVVEIQGLLRGSSS